MYKDTRVVALSEAYTQTQFINRWGRIFFLSAEGCYIWSVWGKCERTKVAGKGAFSLQEDFLTEQRKEEREALI